MPLDYPIHQRTLDNGLRVVVSPDHSVPTVTVNLWVNVGSRHEREGKTGFAHLFEHLMFQGSRNVAEGEHFSRLMAQGARLNATTWFDRTNYFETVPTGAYELALWMEADRHGYLLDAVNQGNLDNQRDVVKEEKRQRYDNRPYGHALEEVYAAVFPAGHPYHHSTIGSMADLDAASLEDVHDFFRRYYGPNNTVLTLVGDVTAQDGLAAAERYFGHLPASAESSRGPVEPLEPLAAPVRVELTEDVPSNRLYLAFRLPVAGSPEFDAAELAMDLLGGLATSRLYRRIVRREQIATSVSRTAMGLVDGTSLGLLVADVSDDVDPDAVEEAVCEELVRLGEEGPTDVEMETLLNDTERWWLSALASHDERADTISQYTLLHDDPQYVNTYLDKVGAMTPERIRDVAARWLTPQCRAVVAYRKEAGA
ncbi:pitrilysin family protein [Luteipulveratus sp. YIM 133132]|uniref:Pitrilysin family protein n=1 Tax=Luteipulveratus flavus TaxID=3031728 RepID=A0ABT6CCR1_9MICO|nr:MULTISPECIES: pitrilysin family protein [unclassified Luteipulveratus]MDE9365869.1 pitrilysin family protein [Luteipulveratus sp. YIM 133132]MDF8265061.1 pitrilysin family protein [Luteipulveratus sp. YIM 133296]